MPNRLIHETSPYLLQHAYNPVNWYPWGKEALEIALKKDKPILVSIGYAACHWCHVMERESFEDETTAAIMNEHFVNIKIDREERPDLDHIYMDAVQAMTGSGGWPLNVFLTPGKEPFYGGTYFPPKPLMNRPSWQDVLQSVANAFKNKRGEIEQQANNMKEHLLQANSFGINNDNSIISPPTESIDIACGHILKAADKVWGGFSKAPKFPQACSIQFLLRYYHTQRHRIESYAPSALQQALLSLDKMIDGGIYDQIGGGFARYATDTEWLVPHFEKMLYDNALLLSILSEAYQITKNEKYKATIVQTIECVERELMHVGKGFYAALDADSEGEEGKFYVWDKQEIHDLLGDDAEIFCNYYDITDNGNWEHKNILRVLKPLQTVAESYGMTIEKLSLLLECGRVKLLAGRSKRMRPALDDKIILAWNALMNTACSKAYAATGIERYKNLAIDNMQFLLQAFFDVNDGLRHVWKNGIAKHPAFLDDYANLIQALLYLHRTTGNTLWLQQAKQFTEKVIEDFSDGSGFFYYTPIGQQDVIIRKKEMYDGATPSGNAIMAQNLFELGLIFDNRDWQKRAEKMITGMSNMIITYPTSFGAWLHTLLQMVAGHKEIVLIGDFEKALPELLSHYLPHTVIMASRAQNENFPLLKNKIAEGPLSIYLCEKYACKKPVFSIKELEELIS